MELGGDLRAIDIADPNSEPFSLSTHADTGEDVHDQFLWSADGHWLAFATFYPRAGMALYVVDMTSNVPGPARLVAGLPGEVLVINELSWSPDSHHLVYGVPDSAMDDLAAPGTLMVAAIEAEQPSAPVTLSESYVRHTLRWAPDGSQLSLRNTAGDRLLVRLDDPLQRAQLGRASNVHVETASWSPDGRYLATFDDALRAYDMHADPPEVVVLSRTPLPERAVASLGWSDDARFLVVQGNLGAALMVVDMHQTAPARTPTVEVAERHGATRDAFDPQPGFRSNDFIFAPGGQQIVFAASDVGWVTMDLATAEVDTQPIAPLDAGLLGFSSASELLWLDSTGIHATSLDRRDRVTLSTETFDDDFALQYQGNGLSAGISPSGDRFVLAGSGHELEHSSELRFMVMDGCKALRATFEYPERYSGTFTPGGYDWRWLNDSSGVMQQTYLETDDPLSSRARLELVRPAGDRMIVRTLMERLTQYQYNRFTWHEQPSVAR